MPHGVGATALTHTISYSCAENDGKLEVCDVAGLFQRNLYGVHNRSNYFARRDGRAGIMHMLLSFPRVKQ